jgi:hypothetical protein
LENVYLKLQFLVVMYYYLMHILFRRQITTGAQFFKPGSHESNLGLVSKFVIYLNLA